MGELDKLMEAARQGDLASITRVLDHDCELVNRFDSSGASAIHYAAFAGHRSVVQELVKRGASINARDRQYGATPAGWAIEYLREMGGFLSVELSDMAHAIEQGEIEWVRRFLDRLPTFREACDLQGKPFRLLAQQSGNQAIARLFGSSLA